MREAQHVPAKPAHRLVRRVAEPLLRAPSSFRACDAGDRLNGTK
jgi:hypothetical protein